MLLLQALCSAAVCALLCSGHTVFFECGAKLDAVDVQGLILSPGFPQNYSSGTHCVWQFFVPAGHQLTMEMFDFDVYLSSERNWTTSGDMSEDGEELPTGEFSRTSGRVLKEQEVPAEIGGGSRNGISARQLSDPVGEEENSTSPSPLDEDDDSETLQLLVDACPDDVLYITDLMVFASRFCGSKRPSADQLVFGSDVEKVEVIMELTTNTHRGRGFALIFRYHNLTTGAAGEVGGQRSPAPSLGAIEALLAAVSLAALFATSLMIVLCVTLRPKLCAKESNVISSISPEVTGQNLHTDGSELQLVTADHREPELNKNNNTSLPHRGDVSECQRSQNAELECSNSLLEMELGPDEVFVISNTETPSFSPHMHRERFLQCSDTGSLQPSDWMPRSEPSNWPRHGSHVGSARPRAWSVRTFHDFLLPFPQLNRKWCSWNLSSPFTKLDVSPGSLVDGSDGSRVLSSQRQRRCNRLQSHTCQQIPEPSGALCDPVQGVEGKICKFPPDDDDDDDLTVPVFVISEEEDREPLVSGEHQNRGKSKIRNREFFSSLSSAHLAVLKSTSSKIHLPC